VLLPAFDFYYLRRLEPDFYVTIINSVHRIREEITSKEDLRHWLERLTLKEILIWQDEEIFTTKIVADFQAVPHYIVAGGDDPYTLYKIIYDVEKGRKFGGRAVKKAYLSYPMTMVRRDEDVISRKDELVRRLRDELGIIVFDPATVEDMILVELLEETDEDPISVPGTNIRIPRSEIEDAKQYIIEQTVIRDYKLIDQSDMVIVFYPVKELSAGVLSEMIYAYTHQKDVYAIFPHRMSPFFKYYSTRVFEDVDGLIEYLKGVLQPPSEAS
jgi:adenylate kinase